LVQQPAVQTFSSVVRYGGIEEMRQGVGAEEIEVGGVGMKLRSVAGSCRNGRPIQGDTRKMSHFDLFPLSKPVNPCFHPVMIRGHGDEKGHECSESHIAAVIPVELVEGYGADETHEENSQSPSCERCAGPDSSRNEAVGAPDHRLELSDARACHNGRPYWEWTGNVKS